MTKGHERLPDDNGISDPMRLEPPGPISKADAIGLYTRIVNEAITRAEQGDTSLLDTFSNPLAQIVGRSALLHNCPELSEEDLRPAMERLRDYLGK